MCFKKKRQPEDRVEARFQTIVALVRDLDKKEFNRLKKGMDLAWQGYQEVRQAKTNAEKEIEDIEDAEKVLDKENGRD